MGDGGKEEEWDAANYDQTNPVTTNADGVYAWDVPKGKWKVKFEKKGYETAYSDWASCSPAPNRCECISGVGRVARDSIHLCLPRGRAGGVQPVHGY